MSSASFFVRVQSLALYKKMLSMYALKILILFLMVNLLLKAIFNLLKARMAKHFLLEISLFVSSKVPRYLHFFQSSFPPLLILCSSVFVSLTLISCILVKKCEFSVFLIKMPIKNLLNFWLLLNLSFRYFLIHNDYGYLFRIAHRSKSCILRFLIKKILFFWLFFSLW